MPVPDRTTATIRGTTIPVMRAGQGDALLLLHGSEGAGEWSPFMDSLAEHFDVIVPQHPGFGDSTLPEWLDTVADLSNFYLDVLEQLRLGAIHLVGIDLGGWIAADLAVRNSGGLLSLVLVAASGVNVPDVDCVDMFLLDDAAQFRAAIFDADAAAATIERVVQPERGDVLLSNRLMAARLCWAPRNHDPSLRKWLHRVDVPTLIVWGAEDRVFPLPFAEAWRELIPGSKLAVLPACGHMPDIEKPAELVSTLVEFEAQIARAR